MTPEQLQEIKARAKTLEDGIFRLSTSNALGGGPFWSVTGRQREHQEAFAELVALNALSADVTALLAYVAELEARLAPPEKPKGGLSAVIGKWPGDETDKQVEQSLKEIG